MTIAALIHIVIILIVFGLCWWLLSTYVLPHVAPPFNILIIVVLALCLILYLLSLVGVVPIRLH